jgi:hypothetical protein
MYHCLPWIGIDKRARKKAKVKFEQDLKHEWQQEAITIFQILTTTAFTPDQLRFTLDWMSKRMDMIVINTSVVLATILAPLSVWFFPKMIFGLNTQSNPQWCMFTCLVSGIVFIASSVSWIILTSQLVKVETEVFKSMAQLRV